MSTRIIILEPTVRDVVRRLNERLDGADDQAPDPDFLIEVLICIHLLELRLAEALRENAER